jgi:hypothetical protein
VDEIQAALGADRNVIFESNRIVDVLKADVCVALVGGQERKPSFDRLLRLADAVLIVGDAASADLPAVPRFEIESSVDRLPAEFVNWLRERLGAARQ